jgi:uncharacterized membrane protein
MYAFAVMVLLGLAVLAIAKIADRYLSLAAEAWAFILLGLGVGAAWLVNFNLFATWGLTVRNAAIGVTLTGLAIGGVAYFWREILALFGGLYRKYTDQAATMEKSENLRRVA